MRENRGFERLLLDGDVHIKIEKDGQVRSLKAFLDNICFDGFAMCLKETIEPDTVIEFHIIAQALDEALIGKAKIRHVTQPYPTPLFTTGVQFTEVNLDMVAHMINRLQAKINQERQKKKQANLFDLIPL